MAGEIENFGNKRGIGGFHKNPQNINRKGGKRKSYGAFVKKCEEKGVEKMGKKLFLNTISYLYQLDESEINDLENDEEQPLTIRLLIKELKDPATRGKVLKDWIDFIIKHSDDGNDNDKELSPEERKEKIKELMSKISNNIDKINDK